MKKLLGEKACYNRLNKKYESIVKTEHERDYVEWYNDIVTDITWEWFFNYKGYKYGLHLCRKSGIITTSTKRLV